MAARIGVNVGTYYQFSNNYHGYTEILEKLQQKGILKFAPGPYPADVTPIVTVPESFDLDLAYWMDNPEGIYFWKDYHRYENLRTLICAIHSVATCRNY
jgi:hypothetical protein